MGEDLILRIGFGAGQACVSLQRQYFRTNNHYTYFHRTVYYLLGGCTGVKYKNWEELINIQNSETLTFKIISRLVDMKRNERSPCATLLE